MSKNSKFFRPSNVARIIGVALVVSGQFMGLSPWKIMDGREIPTNMVQVVGLLLFAWPMIREAWDKWQGRKSVQKIAPLLAVFIGLALSSCYTPPTIRVSDTTAQQEQVAQAEHSLKDFPQDSTVGPKDAAAIAQAQMALAACRATMKLTSEEAQECARKARTAIEHDEKQAARLAELEKENGFFGRVDRFLSTFGAGIVTGVVGLLLLQQFGGAILSAAVTAIRGRIA